MSRDPSEIILIYWFTAQETFLIIINVENNYAASHFCGNSDTFFPSRFIEEQHLFQIYIFVTNVFTDTLLFNASMLNKSRHFYDWLQHFECFQSSWFSYVL